MKPIKQTKTEVGSGNCLAACYASILEVPIESIPDLQCGRTMNELHDILKSKGISITHLQPTEKVAWSKMFVGYGQICILCGPSPRHPEAHRPRIHHAVVGITDGYGFRIIHDPHPTNEGIPEITSVTFLTCDNPAKMFAT